VVAAPSIAAALSSGLSIRAPPSIAVPASGEPLFVPQLQDGTAKSQVHAPTAHDRRTATAGRNLSQFIEAPGS
jgi:hypothetical protein